MILKQTSLHAEHLKLGALMVPFADFDMPIHYSSVKDEIAAVRTSSGIFDVGHMGEFFITGVDATAFADYLVTNDIQTPPMGKAIYSPLCREDGTVVDDLLVYKIASDRILLCVNASNMTKDWEWVNSHKHLFRVKVENHSDEYSLLALQGPRSEEILKRLGLLPSGEFPYYSVKEIKFDGRPLILARTGYTGEDGFELFCSHEACKKLWPAILECGAKPCGLGSRDVLRLEATYPLYGHEIHDHVTPLDANLKWTVKMNKKIFIGKESLAHYRPHYRQVKLSITGGVPRQGYTVENASGMTIGTISSGTHSPTLGAGIALAHIEIEKFPADKNFLINIRGKKIQAKFHDEPFVKGGHK